MSGAVSERCLGFTTFVLCSNDALLGPNQPAVAPAYPLIKKKKRTPPGGEVTNPSATSDGQTVNSRFYQLKQLTAKHPFLCQYVDIHRGLRGTRFFPLLFIGSC